MKVIHRYTTRAYTLIETLIGSSIMMIAVGAAASLSLAMVTQEEMSERTVRAINHLDNAATLYRMGLDSSEILALLPDEPVVTSLTVTAQTESVTGLGNINLADLTVVYKPAASSTNKAGDDDTQTWIGGNQNDSRSHTVRVLRPNP